MNEESWLVRCDDCGKTFTEIYPEGLNGNESYSDEDDPKLCECDSQYTLLEQLT